MTFSSVTIDSQYSYSFYSTDLNKGKFDLLEQKAILINKFKQNISFKIHSNLDSYLDKTKFELIKEFNTSITGLTGQDIQHAISDVYTSYSNKFDAVNNKLKFRVQEQMAQTNKKLQEQIEHLQTINGEMTVLLSVTVAGKSGNTLPALPASVQMGPAVNVPEITPAQQKVVDAHKPKEVVIQSLKRKT